jgi:hypothetical protein
MHIVALDIGWSGLGRVLGVGLIAGVGLVALFATGIRLLSVGPGGSAARGSGPAIAAYACFLVCAVVAGYGLIVLIAK